MLSIQFKIIDSSFYLIFTSRTVYLSGPNDTFERHLDKKEIRNMAGRYSLTPCVFELLKFSNDQPQYSEGHNYFLTGKTPCGKDFKVIVRKKRDGYVLRTYFRI